MPDFSCSLSRIKESTWPLPGTRKNLSSSDLPKDTTSPQIVQQRFKQTNENNYQGWNHADMQGYEIADKKTNNETPRRPGETTHYPYQDVVPCIN